MGRASPFLFRVARTHLVVAAGAGASLAACSDVFGEPLVLAPSGEQSDDGSDDFGARDGGEGGSFGAPLPDASRDLSGLAPCEPCQESLECGGSDDLCVHNYDTSEHFCGRDCLDDGGCPDDHLCVSTPDFSLQSQCLPGSATCTGDPKAQPFPATLAELRAYNLQLINGYRAERGIPALALDSCLTSVAQASAVEVVATGEWFGKFQRECEPFLGECACGWRGENQPEVEASASWQQNFDYTFEQNFDQHWQFREEIVDPDMTLVGIGVVLVSGSETFFFSNTFGR